MSIRALTRADVAELQPLIATCFVPLRLAEKARKVERT